MNGVYMLLNISQNAVSFERERKAIESIVDSLSTPLPFWEGVILLSPFIIGIIVTIILLLAPDKSENPNDTDQEKQIPPPKQSSQSNTLVQFDSYCQHKIENFTCPILKEYALRVKMQAQCCNSVTGSTASVIRVDRDSPLEPFLIGFGTSLFTSLFCDLFD